MPDLGHFCQEGGPLGRRCAHPPQTLTDLPGCMLRTACQRDFHGGRQGDGMRSRDPENGEKRSKVLGSVVSGAHFWSKLSKRSFLGILRQNHAFLVVLAPFGRSWDPWPRDPSPGRCNFAGIERSSSRRDLLEPIVLEIEAFACGRISRCPESAEKCSKVLKSGLLCRSKIVNSLCRLLCRHVSKRTSSFLDFVIIRRRHHPSSSSSSSSPFPRAWRP